MNPVACLPLRASAATPPFSSRCRAAPLRPRSVSRFPPRASDSTAGIYLPFGSLAPVTSRTVVKRRRHKNGIYASLFGVGAPEALVIGVVALLVFGPKGLAEVARNLGKTLRAFQPTIRELQDVSRDFRSTLEREIGLDEVSPSTNYRPTTMNNNEQPASVSNDKPETAVPYTSEELMKVTEEQLAASASAAWNSQQPSRLEQKETAAPSQSSDAALSAGSDGPGAVTSEPNPSNSEKAKLTDEA
ncbi:sec-independent protein translocase protein TATB, chloroplastic isoform X1 [Brachypodium distachyon]|uniref:Sec-independent protein translocase protein TATB, chloroplastic n=1 Tax=Brachypodium distachyon TaxID=15368 RepID=I1GYD2_BRADI|nr:sec-independent protein translocase protein TATB, chloroplastic isoform X1 [Brachypodium distachyon]KQK18243.1 hypothetical protein BRADI_1g39520v3 [Brachypodium distachyon]|eukprot:XP_003563823.1 sec-independent protein translocase protein TATB, chloroplastic isoform X1 [Brachypodium distachyon]